MQNELSIGGLRYQLLEVANNRNEFSITLENEQSFPLHSIRIDPKDITKRYVQAVKIAGRYYGLLLLKNEVATAYTDAWTKFLWMDRIRILFGCKFRIRMDHIMTPGSKLIESRTQSAVDYIFGKKKIVPPTVVNKPITDEEKEGMQFNTITREWEKKPIA